MEIQVVQDHLNILVGTANNTIETFGLDFKDKNAEIVKAKKFDLQGHRSDVRALTFSSCSTAIASVSHESVKVCKNLFYFEWSEARVVRSELRLFGEFVNKWDFLNVNFMGKMRLRLKHFDQAKGEWENR